MKLAAAAKLGLLGIGLKDFAKRHKKAAWIIIALVVLNELRGIAVVYAVVRAWFA